MAQLALRISYDGTDYHGFQWQREQDTVQSTLEHSLRSLLGPGTLTGGSRTDRGVHAEDQVVVWDGACPVPLTRLGKVLNHRLPLSIRVMAVGMVPDGWDPRRMATAKFYRYQIWRGPVPANWARFVMRMDEPLALPILVDTARWFEGRHDFSSFRSTGSSARTTIRQVFTSRWDVSQGGRALIYRVGANGFLYHMVRLMVGAMLEAARTGQTGNIAHALTNPGPTTRMNKLAPPHGLVLERIEIDGKWFRSIEEG